MAFFTKAFVIIEMKVSSPRKLLARAETQERSREVIKSNGITVTH